MVHPLCSLVVVGVGEKAVGRLAYLTVACRLVSPQLPRNRPGMGSLWWHCKAMSFRVNKGGSSGCVMDVPWPGRCDIDSAWPLASPKLAVVV